MIQFKEIELKYRADDIALTDFIRFAQDRKPESSLFVCGYDHFYSDGSDSFMRHRIGQDFNQLTFKSKTVSKNNFIRNETNVMLGKDVTKEEAADLCEKLGYKLNVSIFKTVFVYVYNRYVLSYYVVCSPDLKELGRYVEIEMSEDYPWETEEMAWNELVKLEQEAKCLGITPQARMKKSLFEQFRKG